jgi:hypothetical protein
LTFLTEGAERAGVSPPILAPAAAAVLPVVVERAAATLAESAKTADLVNEAINNRNLYNPKPTPLADILRQVEPVELEPRRADLHNRAKRLAFDASIRIDQSGKDLLGEMTVLPLLQGGISTYAFGADYLATRMRGDSAGADRKVGGFTVGAAQSSSLVVFPAARDRLLTDVTAYLIEQGTGHSIPDEFLSSQVDTTLTSLRIERTLRRAAELSDSHNVERGRTAAPFLEVAVLTGIDLSAAGGPAVLGSVSRATRTTLTGLEDVVRLSARGSRRVLDKTAGVVERLVMEESGGRRFPPDRWFRQGELPPHVGAAPKRSGYGKFLAVFGLADAPEHWEFYQRAVKEIAEFRRKAPTIRSAENQAAHWWDRNAPETLRVSNTQARKTLLGSLAVDADAYRADPASLQRTVRPLAPLNQSRGLERLAQYDPARYGVDMLEPYAAAKNRRTKPPFSPDPVEWLADDGTGKPGQIVVAKDGTWVYLDSEGHAVPYPNGFPDFEAAGLVQDTVVFRNKAGNVVEYAGDRSSDFTHADSNSTVLRNRRTQTWHHHEDLHTLQLLDRVLHDRFHHRGGVSLKKNRL